MLLGTGVGAGAGAGGDGGGDGGLVEHALGEETTTTHVSCAVRCGV